MALMNSAEQPFDADQQRLVELMIAAELKIARLSDDLKRIKKLHSRTLPPRRALVHQQTAVSLHRRVLRWVAIAPLTLTLGMTAGSANFVEPNNGCNGGLCVAGRCTELPRRVCDLENYFDSMSPYSSSFSRFMMQHSKAAAND